MREPDEAIYEVCDVCKGGGESSGPNFCWKCKGTHQRPQPREDLEDGLSEEWHGRREDDLINRKFNQ